MSRRCRRIRLRAERKRPAPQSHRNDIRRMLFILSSTMCTRSAERLRDSPTPEWECPRCTPGRVARQALGWSSDDGRAAWSRRGGQGSSRRRRAESPPPAGARVRLARAVGRPEARMAAAVLRAARDVLSGARRRRGRDPGRPGSDRPCGGGRRAGPDGHGDHPVHGRGLRRAPEPGRLAGVRAARGLPLGARRRLHHRPARRGHARLPVPRRGVREHPAPRGNAARRRL